MQSYFFCKTSCSFGALLCGLSHTEGDKLSTLRIRSPQAAWPNLVQKWHSSKGAGAQNARETAEDVKRSGVVRSRSRRLQVLTLCPSLCPVAFPKPQRKHSCRKWSRNLVGLCGSYTLSHQHGSSQLPVCREKWSKGPCSTSMIISGSAIDPQRVELEYAQESWYGSKRVITSATLVVTSALLVVTRS